MTLIQSKAGKPGTHALVIGVGRYPWLVGGKKKPLFGQNDGMAQLTSPPASARAFADWLLKSFDNSNAPLSSMELLLSGAGSSGQKYEVPSGAGKGKKVAISPATFAHVSKAILAWAKRSTHPDDMLLFFFSGHGISAAIQTTLLCEDFGSEPLAPLSHAIDFTKLRLGLDRIPARRQCFFVDACRVASTTVLETFDFFGQPVIDPVAAFAATPRQAPVFQATLAGDLAYGLKGRPSYFTEALLRAFAGPGSDDLDSNDAHWWVQTDALLRALPPLLQRVVKESELLLPQAPASDLSRFPLHRLKGIPKDIPVDVLCTPDDRTAGAILSCAAEGAGAGKTRQRKEPSADPWKLDLSEGRYTFRAEVKKPARKGKIEGESIRPHYRKIRIPV